MPSAQIREIAAAQRLDNVRYAIRDLASVADEVTKQGHKVLALNVGDPNIFDFETPRAPDRSRVQGHAGQQERIRALSGHSGGPGSHPREAARKGITTVQDAFVTSGASEAVDICLSALVNPGETCSDSESGLSALLCGAVQARHCGHAYNLNEDDAWQPDLIDLQRKINSRTRAIVLINPNNPTGAVCSRRMLEQLAELARRNNLVIFADEIYDKLILDSGEKTDPISIAAVAPDVPVVTFGGLSKNYLAPGWRIGWGVVSGDAAAVKPYVEGIHRLLRARLCANHPEQYAMKTRAGRASRTIWWKSATSFAPAAISPSSGAIRRRA